MAKTIGALLRNKRDGFYLRYHHRVTQQDIANELGIPVAEVDGIESGQVTSFDCVKVVNTYCKYLDLSDAERLELLHTCGQHGDENDEDGWGIDDWQRLLAMQRAASERLLLSGEHDDYLEFKDICVSRRKISVRLTASESAHALCCSIQHGVTIPYWRNRNRDNPDSIESVVFHLKEVTGCRTFMRAGWVLEGLSPCLQTEISSRVSHQFQLIADNGSPVPHMVLEHALAGTTTKLWTNTFRNKSEFYDYGKYVNNVIREISEDED